MSGAVATGALRGPLQPAEVPLRELPPFEQNLPAILDRQARRYGDKPLMRVAGVARSYREARDAAARAAGALRAAGIAPGDRVATMCGNRIELWDVFAGCAWLGAIAVPLNTATRGRQLVHELTNSGARVLLIEPGLVDVLGTIEPPPTLERLWLLDGPAPEIPAGYRAAPAPAPTLGDPLPLPTIPPDLTAAIMYTSGTTGPSKGVECSAAQFYWLCRVLVQVIGIREHDVLFNSLPLYHMNALMTPVEALVAGASCVIAPRFSASRYWELAAEADATVTYLLGALSNRLLAQPPKPGDRSHRVRKLFAPGTSAAVWEPFRERFGVDEIVEGYGSTETSHCIGRTPEHPESIAGCMGWVHDAYFEARIVDEHGLDTPPDVPGELVIRGRHPHSISKGYWGMPEHTVEAFRDLWFHTGDSAVRDEHGCYRFVDRQKDAMRRLGENISSWEVEEAILSHPAIATAAVFPVPSTETDEDVMAAVVLAPGAELDPVDLVGHLEPRLAYFAIPRYVDIVEELAYTTNGKIQKAGLRERGVTATTWDREAAGYELRRRRT